MTVDAHEPPPCALTDAIRAKIHALERATRRAEAQQEDAKVVMLSQLRHVDEQYERLLEQADRHLDTLETTLLSLRERRRRVHALAVTNRQTLRRLEHVLSTPPDNNNNDDDDDDDDDDQEAGS